MCQWRRETLDEESIWDEARSTINKGESVVKGRDLLSVAMSNARVQEV
jgi:hypothetical protein